MKLLSVVTSADVLIELKSLEGVVIGMVSMIAMVCVIKMEMNVLTLTKFEASCRDSTRS